jgi:hypothetical protein
LKRSIKEILFRKGVRTRLGTIGINSINGIDGLIRNKETMKQKVTNKESIRRQININGTYYVCLQCMTLYWHDGAHRRRSPFAN